MTHPQKFSLCWIERSNTSKRVCPLPPFAPLHFVSAGFSPPSHSLLPRRATTTLRVYLLRAGWGEAFIILLNGTWEAGEEGLRLANGSLLSGLETSHPAHRCWSAPYCLSSFLKCRAVISSCSLYSVAEAQFGQMFAFNQFQAQFRSPLKSLHKNTVAINKPRRCSY